MNRNFMSFNDSNRILKWMSENEVGLNLFRVESCDHWGIDISHIFANLAKEIRVGNEIAINLGFDLIIVDPPMPFGKIIKSQILNSFAIGGHGMNRRRIELLKDLHDRWSQIKPYPPREIRYLSRLISKIKVT